MIQKGLSVYRISPFFPFNEIRFEDNYLNKDNVAIAFW